MSREAWGDPPDLDPQFCPLCYEQWHAEDCELGKEVARRLKAERERDELQQEVDGLTTTVIRQGDILSAVVIACRGAPPADTAWSSHDAAELVQALAAERGVLMHARDEWHKLADWQSARLAAVEAERDQLRAEVATMRAELQAGVRRLRGEARVMRDLLRQCADVLETLDSEDTEDGGAALRALRKQVGAALDPSGRDYQQMCIAAGALDELHDIDREILRDRPAPAGVYACDGAAARHPCRCGPDGCTDSTCPRRLSHHQLAFDARLRGVGANGTDRDTGPDTEGFGL